MQGRDESASRLGVRRRCRIEADRPTPTIGCCRAVIGTLPKRAHDPRGQNRRGADGQAGEADRERDFAAFRAFLTAVRTRGSVLAGAALVRPDDARRIGPGEPAARAVTAGPFAETVEELGGFYLVDLPDLATAVEVAALLPHAHTVEVRECVDVDVTGSG